MARRGARSDSAGVAPLADGRGSEDTPISASRRRRRRARRAGGGVARRGLAFALLYVASAAVVGWQVGGRPLYDGFAPPPPYRWVRPPREFAAGNQPPHPSGFDVALRPIGSPVASSSSEDGQLILSLHAGAFAAHAGDTAVHVQLTPLDPAGLGPPSPGLEADGNAYRVEFVYKPSGQAAALSGRIDVFLVVPQIATTLLFSSDGSTWEPLPPVPAGDVSHVGGVLSAPGYLPGATLPSSAQPEASRAPADLDLRAAAGVAAVALAGAIAMCVLARRRQRPRRR